MSHSFNIDTDLGLLFVEFTGPLTIGALLEVDASVRAHPDFDPDFHQILDLSSADGSGLSREDFRLITQRPPAFSDKVRRAFVVGPDDLSFGLGRMFEHMRESPEGQIKFFRDLAEAKAWVGSE